jgi:hypothetical protein
LVDEQIALFNINDISVEGDDNLVVGNTYSFLVTFTKTGIQNLSPTFDISFEQPGSPAELQLHPQSPNAIKVCFVPSRAGKADFRVNVNGQSKTLKSLSIKYGKSSSLSDVAVMEHRLGVVQC